MDLRPSSSAMSIPPMAAPDIAGPRLEQTAGVPGTGQTPNLMRRGPCQQPWVQAVPPFVTSLTVHAGILVIALVAVKLAVSAGPALLLHQEQTVIPEAVMHEASPPGGVLNDSSANEMLTRAIQDANMESGQPDAWAGKAGPQLDLHAGSLGDPDASLTIGLGSGSVLGSPGAGGRFGAGDGSGTLAALGPPGGGAFGPHGLVFGNGGNARKIVFVCDSTGSMLNKMPSLKNELGKAVTGLKPIQSFDVLFFHDDKCLALNATELEAATPESKRKAFRFLESITPSGTTNPLPAIETAFHLQPELIYLLSDAADFPDNKAVLERCRKLNRGHKIKVNTILFYENSTEAERNKDSEELMVQIAREAGGTFRHVMRRLG